MERSTILIKTLRDSSYFENVEKNIDKNNIENIERSESSTLRFCHGKKNIEACVIYRTLRKKACVKTLEHPNEHPKLYLKRSIGTQRKLKKKRFK